jgi:drug/metabolite transporter (DMT)-like permease
VRLRGFVAMSMTACVFGLGVVLAKLLTNSLNGFLIAFLALFGGGCLIAGYLLIRRLKVLPPLSPGGWINLLLLASLGTALPLMLVIASFARTSAIVAGVLLQAQGPAAVLFAALLLGERLTWRQVWGIGLLLLGSVLVVWQPGLMADLTAGLTGQGAASGDAAGDGVGALLVLGGAVAYGFALIPAKRLARQADALQLSALRLLLGSLFVVPILFAQESLVAGPVSAPVAGTLALYIVTSCCLGYIAQQAGLRFLRAWEAAAILLTIPLFTVLFALLLLSETPTPLQITGGAIVIVGGAVVARGASGLNAMGKPAVELR